MKPATPAGHSPEHRRTLLRLAADSIAYGLKHAEALPVQLAEHPPELQTPRATFVTLHLRDELQGCIGTLRPVRPLVVDVARNAYAAAFDDPRGRTLTEADAKALHIDISILSDAEPMSFRSEADLLSQIRPGVDGLIFQEKSYVGTLLPSVWEALPTPPEFFAHLKLKAGLPTDYWSSTVVVKRYTTEIFSNRD